MPWKPSGMRGQVHRGDRVGGEVLGGQDDQVGGAAVGVVDERHHVPVVLACVRPGRGNTASPTVASRPNSCTWVFPGEVGLSIASLNASWEKSPATVIAW